MTELPKMKRISDVEIHHIQAFTSRGEVDGEWIGDEPDCEACSLQLVEKQLSADQQVQAIREAHYKEVIAQKDEEIKKHIETIHRFGEVIRNYRDASCMPRKEFLKLSVETRRKFLAIQAKELSHETKSASNSCEAMGMD